MNKKLIKGSLAGVALVALAAGGGTFASWSDFQDITGNEAGAGVLKLTVSPNAGSQTVFDNVTMAPGGINGERLVYVASNDGASTPSGQLFMNIKDLVGTENGCDSNGERADDANCDSGDQGDFIDDAILQVTSYAVNSPNQCTQSNAPALKVVTGQHGGSLAWWKTQPAYQLTGVGAVDRSYLAPGEGLCVSMDISLAYAVDNASQGDSADFAAHFDLKQAPYGTPRTPHNP